jgi:NADH/F420H2 dehydrogenase subunit C
VEVKGGGSPALQALRGSWAGAIRESSEFRGEETVVIDPASIVPVCRSLRDDEALQFAMLTDLCAIHYLDRDYTYEVVYLLHSFKLNRRLRLKVRLGQEAVVASVTPVWPAAEWMEREAYDLVGVRFEGHPDLRRILMPEDYDRHPLRRDFHLSG